MDPRDFQQLAVRLAAGTSPAELRTAVSRTYYAVFKLGAEILQGMNVRISTGASGHGDVQRYLSNCGDPEIIKIGSQLTDLHSRRIDADYRLTSNKIEQRPTVQALVEQGRWMIQQLEACSIGERRVQMIIGIQTYRQRISS